MKRFITKFYFLPAIALLTLVSVVTVRCKKPTDGININVNTSNLFHYTGVVQVVDPSGQLPNNLTVTVTGANAAAIYGIDGRKSIAAPAGIIAFAVHPKMEPTAASPLKFNLVLTGTGYLPLTIPVTISVKDSNQVIKASILNLVVPTAGVGTAATTAAVTGGTVAAPITLTTPSTGGVSATSVTLPTGTRLQDAAGNTVVGGSVAVNVNNFNTTQQNAVNLFPGGSLAVANISGGTTSSGLFVPAGFANISMNVGSTEIKKFSSPITVNMTLDPSYKNPSTGVALAVGQTLGIYSYDTGTGLWQFEQNVTVGGTATNPTVSFPTSHLTVFTAGLVQQVLPALGINFIAQWLTTGSTANIRVIAAIQNGPAYNVYDQTFTIEQTAFGLIFSIAGKIPTPTATNPVIFTFLSSTGATLATATLATGSSTLNVTLASPILGPTTDLFLQLDCAGAGSNKVGLFTPPDFYLLYKAAGAPVTSYTILGQVVSGHLITQQLLANTNYDFKAVLNQSVKEVFNHTIAENTPDKQTVGGTYNGKAAVAQQNQLDIRSLCNTLP